MEIKINGQKADITLEEEKTVGDILASFDTWLLNSGHRLSGFAIDDQTIELSSVGDAFSRNINTINVLDIFTSTIADLYVMSLLNIIHDIDEYENLGFEEKNNFCNEWEERAQAKFVSEQMHDLFLFCTSAFSGSISLEVLHSIIDERLREVQEPLREIEKLETTIEETCVRLVDLSLDIQTGKDLRAAQTIQIFSAIAEKIIRIYRQLEIQGLTGYIQNTEKSLSQQIAEFSVMVKELLDAYERNDIILVGDLTEYEIAPKLQELYNTIINKAAG
jgi:hypothetical protein